MSRGAFELGAQGELGVVDAGADGADGARDDVGDLLVGHVFEEAEDEDLAVFGGEAVEGGADVGGVFGGEVVVIGVVGC